MNTIVTIIFITLIVTSASSLIGIITLPFWQRIYRSYKWRRYCAQRHRGDK
jgi:O-antigen/teichoic acid export membrane protein